MLSFALTLAILAQAPAADQRPLKFASPGLKAVNISEGDASFYSDHFAQQLKLLGLQVVTAQDISTLIGLERQKQLLGCGDNASSCVTELAGALGADGLVAGSLGKFGPVYQINLSILGASNAEPISVYSARVTGEEPLLDEFTKAAKAMAREVYLKAGRPLPDSLIEKSAGRKYFWIPIVAGAVAAGAGGYAFMDSRDKLKALQDGNEAKVGADSATFAQRGNLEQTVGVALMGAGAAGLVTCIVMYVAGAPPKITPTVTAGPSGAQVSVLGVFP
ncbi:MAG: hypothetical protein ACJ790_06470 [Myxococcaceae bacterium]